MGEVIKSDFLVIGSGIAGLSFAIEVSKYGSVTIVTKKEIMKSNTNLAQGGIAAVLSQNDSFKMHINDTLKTGCGLCNREAVEILVKNGPHAIEWLTQRGVEFETSQDTLDLRMESGHSRRRIAHKGDYTGREIEEALVADVKKRGINTFENYLALDLIVQDRRAYGARVLNLEEKRVVTFLSKATILATGGVGQIYAQTSNPFIATGDGIAMAYRAGAAIEDMEFVQFHPTTLQRRAEPNFLISETVRGEGGILRNSSGEAFMERYHEARDLAPRDVVSRAVFTELKKGTVYLDLTHKQASSIRRWFPTIYKECLLTEGIDITEDQIPIVPAAHYLCGGIKVDFNGESNITGLFAFGECAATGVHGANRLASNSLLESVVFASFGVQRAKAYIGDDLLTSIPESTRVNFNEIDDRKGELLKELQNLMWDHVGIIRRSGELEYAIAQLQNAEGEVERINHDAIHSNFVELRNMITVAKLVTKAASMRHETRGTHYLTEYPTQDDKNWSRHIRFVENNIEVI